MAYSEFISVCVDVEDFKYPKKNNMDWKNIPFSASTSTNLLEGLFFPCKADPPDMVSSCFDPLENFTTQKKAQGQKIFL